MSSPPSSLENLRDYLGDFSYPHTVAIYGALAGGGGRLLGTGSIVLLRDEHFLLTAAHVVEDGRAKDVHGKRIYDCICIGLCNGTEPVSISGPFSCAPFPLDLCVAPIEPSLLADAERRAITTGHFLNSSAGSEHQPLFVHGFPGVRSKTLMNVYSKSLPYLAGRVRGMSSYYDPNFHLAIDYSPGNWCSSDGSIVEFLDPHGLSGSVVWDPRPSDTPGVLDENWTPDRAGIIGLVHRWADKSQQLVVTRIEHIREFLLQVLQQRDAYFRWIGRGRPLGDDWQDWFEAERAIPTLA